MSDRFEHMQKQYQTPNKFVHPLREQTDDAAKEIVLFVIGIVVGMALGAVAVLSWIID